MHSRCQTVHCWHVVKTAHRTRLMRGRDATCERWGSLLHQLFDANPTMPHRYVARLFVREAGLGGEASERQSAILDEITRFILEELGKKAFCRRGSKRTRSLHAAAMGEDEEEIRKGLRRHAALALVPEQACPMELRPDVAGELQRAINQATNMGRGRISALQVFKEDVRTVRRDRADSVLSEAMQTWLASDEATAWPRERENNFLG